MPIDRAASVRRMDLFEKHTSPRGEGAGVDMSKPYLLRCEDATKT